MVALQVLVVFVRSRSVKSSGVCSANWWSLVAISNNKHKNHPKKHLVVMSSGSVIVLKCLGCVAEGRQ